MYLSKIVTWGVQRTMMVIALLFLGAGCTTMDGHTSNDDVIPVADWTNGLSEEQVVAAMPVTISPIETEVVDSDSATSTEAISRTTDAHQITWQVPEDSLSPQDWNVYIKTDDDTWTEIDPETVEISVETVDVDGQMYDEYTVTVPVETEGAEDTDGDSDSDTSTDAGENGDSPVTDYMIEMVDEEGNETATEVSIVTLPEEHQIEVTLSDETNASAPSGVTAVYNGVKEQLWQVQRLNTLSLPQTVSLQNSLSDGASLVFVIYTDISDYSHDETMQERASNSSFCRVEEVTPPSEQVLYRLKYSFEDLPLSGLIYETDGKFDYDDVVLYVDVLK